MVQTMLALASCEERLAEAYSCTRGDGLHHKYYPSTTLRVYPSTTLRVYARGFLKVLLGVPCLRFAMNCPDDYPNSPPKVKLMTTGGGGVRFNPNLYVEHLLFDAALLLEALLEQTGCYF